MVNVQLPRNHLTRKYVIMLLVIYACLKDYKIISLKLSETICILLNLGVEV